MKKLFPYLCTILFLTLVFSGCIEDNTPKNSIPTVTIVYPTEGGVVSSMVKIVGTASDPDETDTIDTVEVKINGSEWQRAEGTTEWSYDWETYSHKDGATPIYVRSWDGSDYSEIEEIMVTVHNPETSETDAHKWAVFVFAGNYPEKNESKLGNGGFYLAEEMAAYFVETYEFSTSNIYILFDDGWIRDDNGYGPRVETVQQRTHTYDFNYGSATENNVASVLGHVVDQANDFTDSTVFLWFAGHGWGDIDNSLTGGKVLERSGIFLWDELLTDRELGDMLYSLRADKTCVIVDACYSGGFADRTILDFPTFFLLRSGIPGSGRIVMTGASKFRSGFASTTRGPLFSLLWFEGITSGQADGYRSGFRSTGKPPLLGLFTDGIVSVEEAFYYARYTLKTDDIFQDYETMEPQIDDQYPHRGILRSKGDMDFE
jgi:hypothetical protein